MQINSLTLVGFRNYREQTLAFDPACNVIHGENAQGKTNLLEAIVYLSCGKSPRTRSDRELITFDGQQARITGKIFSRDREFVTDITLQAGRRRKMTVNGVAAKNAAELSDVLHTVFFCPEDLFLIREGAAARRKFMDQSLCQLRPRYAQALAEYHRLYEHKTRILRDREDNPGLLAMLPDFNEVLPLDKLADAAAACDILVCCIALTPETRGIVSEEIFGRLHDGAIFVNVARGALADEAALTKWLQSGGRAVLDVFEAEPLPESSPLWDMENVLLTPHNSFVGEGNRARLWRCIQEALGLL